MKQLGRALCLLPFLALPARAGILNLANPAGIKVYSGGHLIYQGVVDSGIQAGDNSNLYTFQDRCVTGSDKTVAVSGDIVITQTNVACPQKPVPPPAFP